MSTIYLVRHGNYDYLDKNLTQLGKVQAEEAGKLVLEDLKGKKYRVLSSPKKRAIEAASIAFKEKVVEKDERFDELGSLTSDEWNDLLGGDEILVIITHQPIIVEALGLYEHRPFIGGRSVFKIEGTSITML